MIEYNIIYIKSDPFLYKIICYQIHHNRIINIYISQIIKYVDTTYTKLIKINRSIKTDGRTLPIAPELHPSQF